MKGYKLWGLKPKARCFVSRNVVFDETQMTVMCRDIEKGKEKVQSEVKPSGDGSNL